MKITTTESTGYNTLNRAKSKRELSKEYDFVRVERRIEKNGLLRPYDMSKVEEINPDVLGFNK